MPRKDLTWFEWLTAVSTNGLDEASDVLGGSTSSASANMALGGEGACSTFDCRIHQQKIDLVTLPPFNRAARVSEDCLIFVTEAGASATEADRSQRQDFT